MKVKDIKMENINDERFPHSIDLWMSLCEWLAKRMQYELLLLKWGWSESFCIRETSVFKTQINMNFHFVFGMWQTVLNEMIPTEGCSRMSESVRFELNYSVISFPRIIASENTEGLFFIFISTWRTIPSTRLNAKRVKYVVCHSQTHWERKGDSWANVLDVIEMNNVLFLFWLLAYRS